MLTIAVGGKARMHVEGGIAARDDIKDASPCDRPQHLSDDVGDQIGRRKPAAGPQTDRNCWIEVTPGHMADRITPAVQDYLKAIHSLGGASAMVTPPRSIGSIFRRSRETPRND